MVGRAGSISPPAPDSGQLIAGKYRIVRVIGEGGMGTVLAANHELLDVPVAVKVLSAELTHQPGIMARFLREARAVARLKSEHVARVMDVGTLDEGQPFIVMELLEGEDLEKRVQRGPLPVADAADFILQALEAMAQAHAIGIVHRDLKPANLFVAITPEGREIVKVLDFGIAKLTHAVKADGSRTGALTGEHATVGSPSYMAPEQVRAAPEIDARADIWALGAILYELLTGLTAFPGVSVGEIFGAVLHSTPAAIRTLRPEVPEALEALVARCLERAPQNRFADVGELARALGPFATAPWQDYPARIEQRLARAGKASDPETARVSKLGLESAALEAFGPENGSEPRSRRRPIFSPVPGTAEADRPEASTAHTAADLRSGIETPAPVVSSPASPSRGAVIAVPLAAALAIGGVAAAMLLRAPSSPTPASPSRTSSAPPPPTEMPSVTAIPALSAPPTVAMPAAVAPSSAAPEHTQQPPTPPAKPPHKHAASHAPAAASAHGSELPGVLNSPD